MKKIVFHIYMYNIAIVLFCVAMFMKDCFTAMNLVVSFAHSDASSTMYKEQ